MFGKFSKRGRALPGLGDNVSDELEELRTLDVHTDEDNDSVVVLPGESGSLVFGLEWRSLTGLDVNDQSIKKNKEIRQYAKALKAQRCIEVGIDPSSVAGFMPGKPPKKAKLYSAAAFVAANVKEQNALLFYAFATPNKYALIGIRDKKPLAGFDLVGTQAEVIDAGKRFIQRAGQAGVQVYFDGEFGEHFQIREFHPNSQWHPFENYAVEEALLKPPPSEAKKIVVLFAGLTFVGAAYVGGSEYLEHQRMLDQASRKQDPMMLYRQSLDALLVSEFQNPAAVDASRYQVAVGNLPTKLQPETSWRLQSLVCTSGTCFVTWERINGTNQGLSLQRNAKALVFSDDLKTSSEQIEVKQIEADKPEPESFPAFQDFKLLTGSVLQTFLRVGINVSLSAPALAGVWPNGNPPPGVSVVKRGTWSISGPVQFHDALMDLPANMSLSNYTVAFNDMKATFTAEGYYYVR